MSDQKKEVIPPDKQPELQKYRLISHWSEYYLQELKKLVTKGDRIHIDES